MDDKADIVAFARESAKSGVDLYDLLGVDGNTSRDDIHRAWRRKGLKYHPDKAGANYDPTLYERFARARDVLVDNEARKVYDTGRAAAAQRRLQSDQMSAERRRFKDELEAAEKEHGATSSAAGMGGAPFGAPTPTTATASTERDKLREAGRRRAEERQRREQEAQDKVRQREDERIAEIEQRLREKEDKARRRAEKKGGVPPPPTTSTAPTSQQPPAPQADAEWRKILKTSAAQAKAGDAPTVQQRPLFAYTMDRLKTAGAAQRQKAAGDASTTLPPFEPQWEEIDDPEVRNFITRVPKFAPAASSTRTGDVPMDTAV